MDIKCISGCKCIVRLHDTSLDLTKTEGHVNID